MPDILTPDEVQPELNTQYFNRMTRIKTNKGGSVESYILRIYRRQENNPMSFIGILEETGTEERKSFTNLDELWDILNSLKKRETGRQRDYIQRRTSTKG